MTDQDQNAHTSGSGFSRREFLKSSAIFGGGLSLIPLVNLDTLAGPEGSAPSALWYLQPLRILQTVLRETDAKNYDAAAVVGYMEKAGCNTLVVNAGGIVDFFQNPLPAANVNPFMQGRDILKEITTACKEAGFRVIGRVDFRGVEEEVYAQYPDWFSVDDNGKPFQLDYTRPRLYASCYTGHYRNEHAEEFIKYLFMNYSLDGIWHNSIGVGGICYCDRCKSSYQSASGKGIPNSEKAYREELNEYMDWKSAMAEQHMEHMKRTVKQFGEDKVYTAEVFSMFESGGVIHSGIDLYNARDHFDFLVSVAFLTENSEHIHYEDLTYANTIIKFLKSMAPEKEAIILYGGNGTAHRYVMDPPEDLKVWLWEALAAGGRFWNCNFTGQHPDATHDRRNAFNNTQAYHFVKEHQGLLANHCPVANIGIYYSRPTRLFYRSAPPEGDRFDASIKGVEKVLNENHLLYDFIPDDQLSLERLNKYSLIILPNVRCISDAETEIFKTFVQNGGNMLATFATGLHYLNGKERENFALSSLFGCSYSGEKVNTRKDNYQFIADSDHPMVKEYKNETELLLNAGFTVLTKAAEGSRVVCTHIPTVHNQPPEKAWVQEWSRKYPTLIENKYGNGKVLYYANQPGQLSQEMSHPDVRNLLFGGIKYLAGRAVAFETNAPESVHMGLTESNEVKGRYILSFVNTTSGPTRPIRSLVPVHNINAKFRLNGKSLKGYQVMRSQGNCLLRASGNELQLSLSNLEDFCAVHIEMNL